MVAVTHGILYQQDIARQAWRNWTAPAEDANEHCTCTLILCVGSQQSAESNRREKQKKKNPGLSTAPTAPTAQRWSHELGSTALAVPLLCHQASMMDSPVSPPMTMLNPCRWPIFSFDVPAVLRTSLACRISHDNNNRPKQSDAKHLPYPSCNLLLSVHVRSMSSDAVAPRAHGVGIVAP